MCHIKQNKTIGNKIKVKIWIKNKKKTHLEKQIEIRTYNPLSEITQLLLCMVGNGVPLLMYIYSVI